MRRGELWAVAGGVYASKPRPALILQDDAFELTESVTVLPLTSILIDAPYLRYRIQACKESGLRCESDVMIDKLTTVRRSNVVQKVGVLNTKQLVDIERLVAVFLGLAR